MPEKMTKEEFYNVIEEWISKPKESWNHITLVAYFYWKYKQKNGVEYTPARWSGNPASSKECRDFTKVFNSFAPDKYSDLPMEEKRIVRIDTYNKVYNYINWMFDYKCRYGDNSKAITTQFFLAPYSMNEFQLMYSKAVKAGKSKDKITELISWCQKENPEVLDLHQIEKPDDIKMILKYAERYCLPDNATERILVKKAMQMGII